VELFTQQKMEKATRRNFNFFNGIKRLIKWILRCIYIILAACMIGFSNAYYNESRTLNDIRNQVQQEQVIDDEDTNENIDSKTGQYIP
jgi:hypothetical protein